MTNKWESYNIEIELVKLDQNSFKYVNAFFKSNWGKHRPGDMAPGIWTLSAGMQTAAPPAIHIINLDK